MDKTNKNKNKSYPEEGKIFISRAGKYKKN